MSTVGLVLILWLAPTGAAGQGSVCLPPATAQAWIAYLGMKYPYMQHWTIPCPAHMIPQR